MFCRFKSLGEALSSAYPEYDWNLEKFSFRGKKSAQRWLLVKLKELLPYFEIIEDYYHPELEWEGTYNNNVENIRMLRIFCNILDHRGKSIQLDIWVPHLKLALEYQGYYYYYYYFYFN